MKTSTLALSVHLILNLLSFSFAQAAKTETHLCKMSSLTILIVKSYVNEFCTVDVISGSKKSSLHKENGTQKGCEKEYSKAISKAKKKGFKCRLSI